MNTEAEHPELVIFRVGAGLHRAPYHHGETLLDTARRSGISIATSCENGDCGTCMVEVLEGSVQMHANNALTEEDLQSGCVLACQGVPVSRTCKIEIF